MKTLKQAIDELKTRHYARAVSLLKSTTLTIDEVARRAGISSRTVYMLGIRDGIQRPAIAPAQPVVVEKIPTAI